MENAAEHIKTIGDRASDPHAILEKMKELCEDALETDGSLIDQHDKHILIISQISAKTEHIINMWKSAVRPILEIGSAMQEQMNTFKDEHQISEIDYQEGLE